MKRPFLRPLHKLIKVFASCFVRAGRAATAALTAPSSQRRRADASDD